MTQEDDQRENLPPFVSPPGTRLPTSRRDPQPPEEEVADAAPPPMLEELADEGMPTSNLPISLAASETIEWLAPLNNRLIVGGLSVLALLALVSLILFVFGLGEPRPIDGPRVVASDDELIATPELSLTAVARNTATMFNGPGDNFAPLGTIRRGVRVGLVGRNEDNTWLQVNYPPGSSLEGWVDVAFLDVTGDISTLVVAGPGDSPDIVVPTSVVADFPTDTPVPDPTDTPEPDDDPTDTPEPEVPTDTPGPTATSAFATLTPEQEPADEGGLTDPGTLTQTPPVVDAVPRRDPPTAAP